MYIIYMNTAVSTVISYQSIYVIKFYIANNINIKSTHLVLL